MREPARWPIAAMDAGVYQYELSVQIASPSANEATMPAAAMRAVCRHRLTRCSFTREASAFVATPGGALPAASAAQDPALGGRESWSAVHSD